MTLTIQETINKVGSIDSIIERVAEYDMKKAIDEHECDACDELINILREYKSIILNTKIDL